MMFKVLSYMLHHKEVIMFPEKDKLNFLADSKLSISSSSVVSADIVDTLLFFKTKLIIANEAESVFISLSKLTTKLTFTETLHFSIR